MAKVTVDHFQDQLATKPESRVILATGSTQIPVYDQMVKREGDGQLSFRYAISYNLDEYCGVSPEHHVQTYHYFMNSNLFGRLNNRFRHSFVLDWRASDCERECQMFEQVQEHFGYPDIALIGIGGERSPHIAFNERGSSLHSITRVVRLDLGTIIFNSRCFMDAVDLKVLGLKADQIPAADFSRVSVEPISYGLVEEIMRAANSWSVEQMQYFFNVVFPRVPQSAMTMGIASIFRSKMILMTVNGEAKAPALKKALIDDPTEEIPASLLKTHPNVVVVAEVDAASQLPAPYNEIGEHTLI